MHCNSKVSLFVLVLIPSCIIDLKCTIMDLVEHTYFKLKSKGLLYLFRVTLSG